MLAQQGSQLTRLSSARHRRPFTAVCAAHAPTCSVQPAVEPRHNALLRQGQLLISVARSWYAQQQLPAPSSPKDLRAQMAAAGRSCMAALPLAATTVAAGYSTGDIFEALAKAIDIYLFLLTVRVLMSWFRNINWYSEPFRTLRAFTDPALNACRGIIPPIGGMDLSPMLLFFGLNFAARQLKIMAIGA